MNVKRQGGNKMIKKISLNGQWDFVADLDPKYHGDIRIYPDPPYAKPDANRRHWIKAMVPGVWQKYAERYDIYEGVCWFAREFELNGYKEGTAARVRFGAVNYFCRVFLNGKEVGQHETGYTEFTIDVTKQLKEGSNHIAVMVDNRATTTKWPPCLGYFNYGGIHRAVTLEIMENVCLDSIILKGCYDMDMSTCRLRVTGKVTGANKTKTNGDSPHNQNCNQTNGDSPEYKSNSSHKSKGDSLTSTSIDILHIEISCYSEKTEAKINADGTIEGELILPNVKPWTPEEPNLYPVSIKLIEGESVSDIYEVQYGFKSVKIQDGKIYLNGKPVNLKGVCYVYDSTVTGLVMTLEQIETDVKLMKEMGCNAVRCHYPMDKQFYEVCDRYGILVWIEPTVYCYHPLNDETNTGFSNPEWTNLAQRMAIEMIRVARNHPSVTIYGIGNECNTYNTEAQVFFEKLAKLIRNEDPARLISYAALYGIVGPVADMVDVLGINSYWGWYDKIFGGKGLKPEGDEWQKESNVTIEPIDLEPMRKMLDKVLSECRKNLVLFLTEFGADSVPGFYSKSRDLWSENYHADLLKEIFKLSDEYHQIAGTFPFCFSDYRDPSKVPNGYWNEINLKGVVTYERRKKLAFDTLKHRYTTT